MPDVDNPGEFIDLTNSAIEDRTPEWTLNTSVGHTFVLGNGTQITSQFGVYAQAGYEWMTDELDSPDSFCFQDSYSKVRARVTWLPPVNGGLDWEASLFGSNIADERYLADCKVDDPSGTFMVRYDPPSRWGWSLWRGSGIGAVIPVSSISWFAPAHESSSVRGGW